MSSFQGFIVAGAFVLVSMVFVLGNIGVGPASMLAQVVPYGTSSPVYTTPYSTTRTGLWSIPMWTGSSTISAFGQLNWQKQSASSAAGKLLVNQVGTDKNAVALYVGGAILNNGNITAAGNINTSGTYSSKGGVGVDAFCIPPKKITQIVVSGGIITALTCQ